jgi:dolichol kinase
MLHIAGTSGKTADDRLPYALRCKTIWQKKVSFLVSLIILSFINGINPPIILVSLLTAIGATILETFSKLGIDNLTVPIGSATIAYFLTQIFISS